MKFEVPQGWEGVRLGDVADIAFSGVDKKTIEGETPVRLCNYTDVYRNRRILPTADFMAATATSTEIRRWSLKKGDVLFTKDSETPTDIGVPSHVTENMPDVLCGYHLGRARPNPNFLEGDFLAHALASQAVAKELSRIANGITRFGLTLPGVRSLLLAVPRLSEQRAIAAVLDSIDGTIERTEAVIAATEQLRDATRHQLLTQGLPGWHSEWNEAPGFGLIPADWKVVRLNEIAHVIGGSTPSRAKEEYWNGDIPWVVPSELSALSGRFLTSTQESITEEGMKAAGLRVIPAGSVLLTSRATIGAVAINTFPLVTNQGFKTLVARRGTHGLWLFYYISAMPQELERRASGSTFREISAADVCALPICLPSLEEQEAIARTLDSVDNVLEAWQRKRGALAQLKASTAEALLTGQRRVPLVARASP